MEIFGISIFNNIVNWFSGLPAIILFVLILSLLSYYFYTINFGNRARKNLSSGSHYSHNFFIFGLVFVFLFVVSKYLLNMDLVMSVIFTGLFYSISIFILTVTLLVLRRYKIKKYILANIDLVNKMLKTKDAKSGEYIEKLCYECREGNHKYLLEFNDLLLKNVNRKGKNLYYIVRSYDYVIDKSRFEDINIWEDKNKDPRSNE